MGIALNKTRLQLVIVVIPLVLILAGGSYYYFFIRPRQGVSHERFLVPDTAVRAVVKPVLVQHYVSSLAPAGTRFIKGVPKVTSMQQFSFRTEWIHKMPFEFTFLLDQRSPDFQGVTLFIQEHPSAESFEELVNDDMFFRTLHPVQWKSETMMRQGRNDLIALGTLPVPVWTRDAVSDTFPNYVPLDPPSVSGKHFVEIAVNNRNGALMELQGALPGLVGVLDDPGLEERMRHAWGSVGSARFTADLGAEDRLDMHIEILCGNTEQAFEAATILQEAAQRIQTYLNGRFGFTLEGTAHPLEDGTAHGDYILTGFENRLRRAVGG